MNVGELRKALADVSDAREVCIGTGMRGLYAATREARTRTLLSNAPHATFFLDADSDPGSKKQRQLVFVIE